MKNWHVDLSGKVAIVTGGRRGIGLAMATGLAAAGARLAVVSASADADELKQKIDAVGGALAYFQVDLADAEQRHGLIDKVVDRFGRLDILVNNAGTTHREPAATYDMGKWNELLNVMLNAVFDLSQQAAHVMIPQGSGCIVNTASMLSFSGGWTVPAYAAAKHGVAGLTKALANEWAKENIKVNAIAPGYILTDLNVALFNDTTREPDITSRIPAGYWAKPEEIVGPLLFLCSDAASYVHGHLLCVDGGWMAR